MTETGAESLAELLEERQHLLKIALWMFGSAVTAERIVQETYRRGYALDEHERAGIAVPRAWLTRVAGGLCLELLAATVAGPDKAPEPGTVAALVTGGLARTPKPVTGGSSRTPEPVIGAVQRIPAQARPSQMMLDRHDRVVRTFAAACATGEAAAVRTVLAADAMVVSDGGGKLRAPDRPTFGAEAVARFVAALLTGQPCTDVAVESVNGRTGLVLRRSGQAVAAVSVSVARTAVTAVWIVLNPDKLQRWHRP
ncbi:hypothetical protein ACQEVF_23885 [Nonomuraea polychroma]|uniref:hypothetical protein n=1 Tax=Nonomuraea polychroma TaxID=46176 RepID=UPI003D901C52